MAANPSVTVADGNGTLGALTPNGALNRFEITYTADASDDMIRLQIEEVDPLVQGNIASKTFTFEVNSNLVQTSTTNVTNATGGEARIMGTQDNTQIYVPPFALAGANNTQALSLTIERYGDPGDDVEGTNAESVSAVYDFEFDDEGVTIDENHTFTITMSFQLPAGMTQEEFVDSLEIRYFDAGDQEWKTDGISNVRINWTNSTIMFEVSHLSKFAAFSELRIETILIQKCTAKAGKSADQDSISFSCILQGVTANDLANATQITIVIESETDDYEVYNESLTIDHSKIKRGKYSHKSKTGFSLKLDTNKDKCTLKGKNLDLTGLSCPLILEIEIGDYLGVGVADESIVNGPKKSIPPAFMMGVKDILEVNQFKLKCGKKPSSDSLSVKGTFTVEDVQTILDGINNGDPIGVILGSQTFPVSPGKSAKFDPVKCTFSINLKNLDITEYGEVDFSIDLFGIELGPIKVTVPECPEPPSQISKNVLEIEIGLSYDFGVGYASNVPVDYQFDAWMRVGKKVVSGTVETPNGIVYQAQWDDEGENWLGIYGESASLAGLSDFTEGIYIFTVTYKDGSSESTSILYALDDGSPIPPVDQRLNVTYPSHDATDIPKKIDLQFDSLNNPDWTYGFEWFPVDEDSNAKSGEIEDLPYTATTTGPLKLSYDTEYEIEITANLAIRSINADGIPYVVDKDSEVEITFTTASKN